MKNANFLLTLVLPLIFLGTACTDDAPKNADTGGESDRDTDTGGDSASEGDSDTSGSIFSNIDCEGLGADPLTCEYEWCRKKQPYELELNNCAVAMTVECQIYLNCYDAYFECMETACPLGTAVPEGDAKDPLYACDNTFTYCTLAAEN